MTAAEFAKWSCVALAAFACLWHLAFSAAGSSKRSEVSGCGMAVGVFIGLLLRAWFIVAICLWWHP